MMNNMTSKTKGKILIVDDEKSMCTSLSYIIEMEGYEVCTLENGYKAIEKVKETSFDVAFLDIKMPGINGVETFKEIKKISPETSVVMMTAYAVEDLLLEALSEGAYTFMYKPFNVEKIIEIIQNIQKKNIILIIDDDLNLCKLLKSRLQKQEYKVISIAGGKEAVKLLERKPVDVILLDVVMPEMDGIEVLKKIKEITKEKCPEVIMMSSYEVGEQVKECLRIGAKKFLKKPIDISVLEKSIKELLKGTVIGKSSILVVDDDVSFGNILSNILTESGYEVKVATNGQQAIEEIKVSHHNVILLDIKLPDISGIEVYNEIKRIYPEAGVAMMTGYSKEEAIMEAIRKGDYICLYKPFEPKEMLEIVKKIIGDDVIGDGPQLE